MHIPNQNFETSAAKTPVHMSLPAASSIKRKCGRGAQQRYKNAADQDQVLAVAAAQPPRRNQWYGL
jgi:hypothetical protein